MTRTMISWQIKENAAKSRKTVCTLSPESCRVIIDFLLAISVSVVVSYIISEILDVGMAT